MPSLGIIRELGAICDEDAQTAGLLLVTLQQRARDLALRLEDKRQAARWQLYARVAAWHREHHPDEDVSTCPVCGTNLDDVPDDALVDLSIRAALDRCREADADVTKTAAEWLRDETAAFLAALPSSCRAFADRELPATIEELYRKAFVDELMAQPAFSGTASALPGKQQGPLERGGGPASTAPGGSGGACSPSRYSGEQCPHNAHANVVCALQLAAHRNQSKDTIETRVKRYIGASRSIPILSRPGLLKGSQTKHRSGTRST